MHRIIYILFFLSSLLNAQNIEESVATYDLSGGEIIQIKAFPSVYISNRNVNVWLPDNYNENQLYKVIYMHDGQMLFDAKTTWNGQEWGVDEWATQLQINQETPPFIVVGIHNHPKLRWYEYFPEQAFSISDENQQQTINKLLDSNKYIDSLLADNYLKFITEELKPYIDNRFNVSTAAKDTFVMGSSMGGLISLYAVCRYPQIFGGAACLSTHWPGAHIYDSNLLSDLLLHYFKVNIPKSGFHKFYFDYGNQSLDKYYPKYAPLVDQIMYDKGYSSFNYKQLFFEGANHSEDAWRSRLNQPVNFLLNP